MELEEYLPDIEDHSGGLAVLLVVSQENIWFLHTTNSLII